MASFSGKSITSKVITQTCQPNAAPRGIGTGPGKLFIISLMLPQVCALLMLVIFVCVHVNALHVSMCNCALCAGTVPAEQYRSLSKQKIIFQDRPS